MQENAGIKLKLMKLNIKTLATAMSSVKWVDVIKIKLYASSERMTMDVEYIVRCNCSSKMNYDPNNCMDILYTF